MSNALIVNLYQVHIYFQEESPFWNILIFICLKNVSWHKNTSALGGLESRDSRSKRTPLHTESFLRLAGLPHKLLVKKLKGSLWFISRTHLKFPCLMKFLFQQENTKSSHALLIIRSSLSFFFIKVYQRNQEQLFFITKAHCAGAAWAWAWACAFWATCGGRFVYGYLWII